MLVNFRFSQLLKAEEKRHYFRATAVRAKLAEIFFDCSIELINQTELKLGDTACAEIVFGVINLVSSRIQLGCSYELFEGAKLIGTFLIETDLWSKIDDIVQVGEEKLGTIQSTNNWTRAILELDGEATTQLSSKNVGLQPWAEITEKLKIGDRVKIKVEKVDKQNRIIEVSFVGKAQ